MIIVYCYPKNRCFQTVVVEKTLESLLDCKEIKPVDPQGNQPWIFIERTDAEAPILWLPEAKKWLIRKDWCWERLRQEKGAMEDEMVGWHHRLNGHEFEQTSRDSEGQGRLACWVHGFAKSRTQLSDCVSEAHQSRQTLTVSRWQQREAS